MIQKTKQQLLALLLSIGLAYVASKFVGQIVYAWLKPVSGLGPQPQCPECFDGFILSYLFFVSLIINLFTFEKKNIYWLILLMPLLIYINPPFEFFIISIGLIILGWLLSKGILFIIRKAS